MSQHQDKCTQKMMGKDATYCFNQTSDILVDENVILATNKKAKSLTEPLPA